MLNTLNMCQMCSPIVVLRIALYFQIIIIIIVLLCIMYLTHCSVLFTIDEVFGVISSAWNVEVELGYQQVSTYNRKWKRRPCLYSFHYAYLKILHYYYPAWGSSLLL